MSACPYPGCTADLTGATLAERRAHSRERHPLPSLRVPPVTERRDAAIRAVLAAKEPTEPEPVPVRRRPPVQRPWAEPAPVPYGGILELALVVLFVAAVVVTLLVKG